LGLNISGTKFFTAKPLKAFFIYITRRIGYTHFWSNWVAVQKNTPWGAAPTKFFFNSQTSLQGPPWFRKTSFQKDLNFRHIFELLKGSAPFFIVLHWVESTFFACIRNYPYALLKQTSFYFAKIIAYVYVLLMLMHWFSLHFPIK
jgi:hypothetical protein